MSGPLRVLIVDDSSGDAELIAGALRQGGLAVSSRRVDSAEAVRAALRQDSWDVILCDYSGSRVGPGEALAMVKESGLDPPFIIVSSLIGEEQAVEAMRIGCHDYVLKDHLERLAQVVRRELREAELRRRGRRVEETPRESDEKYRMLFEESREAIYIRTPEGRLLDINPAGAELLGYSSKEEALQAGLGGDLLVDPADGEEVSRRLEEQGFVKDYELRLRTGDHGEIVVLETATAVRDEAGRVALVRGFWRDVTERRKLGARLRQAQKMEALGTLASGIAHDFNNLLTAILGYTEMAKETLPAEHPATRSLDMVEEAARQAGGVTKSLLTFSRTAPSEKSPVDLRRVIGDSARLLRRVLPASIELVDGVSAGESIWVNADATQIQQVLMNLAVNSRDAMPEGGRLRIELRREPTEAKDAGEEEGAGQAVLEVEDNGSGMSQETRSRIFEPFFTTKQRGKGTGLGMSMIHGIVTDHGGRIEVRSAPGAGTRVTVWLPCCGAPVAGQGAEPRPGESAGRGEVIIVVEDNDHVRSIMTSMLRAQGYYVVQAADGMEALAAFRTHQETVRLVVLDLDLPRSGGLTCLGEFRQWRADLPVVVVTGSVEPVPAAATEGDAILLRKPFQMCELAATVAGQLSGRAAPEEVQV